MSTRTLRSKKTKPKQPVETKPLTFTPADLNVSDWLEEAFSGLNDARRALALRAVNQFRGEANKAELEAVVFEENMERVHNALIHIDELSAGGAS